MSETRVIRAGVNEFKIIEFHVAGEKQGINLVKAKKIIEYSPEIVTKLADSHSTVKGILEVDGSIITIIDLQKIYGYPEVEAKEGQKKCIIVTEFNNAQYGFIVDNIEKVHRISWESLQPVGKICPTDLIVGVASIEEGIDIQLVDFETIIGRLFPKSIIEPGDELVSVEADIMELRKEAVIICADDSKVIRKKLDYVFKKHNFKNVTICSDGGEALEVLVNRNSGETERQGFTFMVTDIEMPQMNGLTLCEKVKERYPDIPVLILSSLISKQMMNRCIEVNANAALSKSDMDTLIAEIDRLLLDQHNNSLKVVGTDEEKAQKAA